MYRSPGRLFWCVPVLCGLVLAAAAATAGGNTIRRIDPPRFDALVKNSRRPLIVAMMASWCGPCIRELPTLDKLYRRYRNRGLDIIGVSLDFEGPAAMQPIVDSLGVRFPVYWMGEAGVRTYNISGIPLLWIVKNGQVREKILGGRSESFLEKKILPLIGVKQQAP